LASDSVPTVMSLGPAVPGTEQGPDPRGSAAASSVPRHVLRLCCRRESHRGDGGRGGGPRDPRSGDRHRDLGRATPPPVSGPEPAP
jgi:hypothetical protein